jgi:hypothetical protein
MAADGRFAVVDGVGVIDEDALDLGVPVLTARLVGGRWLGGARLRAGGSEEGGLEELVEFWLSRCWSSATC